MNHDPKSTGWVECPPNTIGKMLVADDTLKNQVMRRTLLIGGGVTLTAVTAGVLSVFQDGEKGSGQAQLTCREVNQHLADYVANKIEDQRLVTQIGNHLAKCGWCAKQHQKMVG